MSDRPTIPEVFDDFAAYHAREPAWGSLHVVLEDNNCEDHNVEHCAGWARERGDAEGERLAAILLRMTPTQRGKIPNLVHGFESTGKRPGWPEPRPPTHDDAFLADIIAGPSDDTPRLVYADWLDEHGQPERAEFIRVQCELARRFGTPADGSPVVTGDGEADAEEIVLRRRERELLGRFQGRWTTDALDLIPCRHRSPLLQLCARDATRVGRWPSDDAMFRFRRGFFERVTLSAADWLAHGAAIRKAAPVTRARLTTIPDIEGHSLLDPREDRRYRLRGGKNWIPLVREDTPEERILRVLRAEFPGVAFEVPRADGWADWPAAIGRLFAAAPGLPSSSRTDEIRLVAEEAARDMIAAGWPPEEAYRISQEWATGRARPE